MPREARPLVFLGTPLAAATILSLVLENGFTVAHVVTRPDARRARGSSTTPSAVKQIAIDNAISVSHDMTWLQENSSKDLLGLVVAYGKIIPTAVLLNTPMVNVHFSLLPRWRGAAPVERAILAGDKTTGVCIMDVEPTLDTGAVFAKRELEITPAHTTHSLTGELAVIGGELLVETLRGGLGVAVPQHGDTTYAAKISPDDLRLDWDVSSIEIERSVRAVRAFTMIESKRLRVIQVEAVSGQSPRQSGSCDEFGVVGTRDGAVRLVSVQPEGKGVMDAMAWLRGRSSPKNIQFS